MDHVRASGYPSFNRGHGGVGIDSFHEESPFVEPDCEVPVRPGMMFAVEVPWAQRHTPHTPMGGQPVSGWATTGRKALDSAVWKASKDEASGVPSTTGQESPDTDGATGLSR